MSPCPNVMPLRRWHQASAGHARYARLTITASKHRLTTQRAADSRADWSGFSSSSNNSFEDNFWRFNKKFILLKEKGENIFLNSTVIFKSSNDNQTPTNGFGLGWIPDVDCTFPMASQRWLNYFIAHHALTSSDLIDGNNFATFQIVFPPIFEHWNFFWHRQWDVPSLNCLDPVPQ